MKYCEVFVITIDHGVVRFMLNDSESAIDCAKTLEYAGNVTKVTVREIANATIYDSSAGDDDEEEERGEDWRNQPNPFKTVKTRQTETETEETFFNMWK